ncbi:hypothetical protein AAVH_18428 [Aphelenchoides avenae]|nr:hypothetical protein AAVH_18428 [Aphelenchus avenae]
MQRFKERERRDVFIGSTDPLFPPPQENSGVTSESGGSPFSAPSPTTTKDQRDERGAPVRPEKGLAPLVQSQQSGPLLHSTRAGLLSVECSQRPPCSDSQPEEEEEKSLSAAIRNSGESGRTPSAAGSKWYHQTDSSDTQKGILIGTYGTATAKCYVQADDWQNEGLRPLRDDFVQLMKYVFPEDKPSENERHGGLTMRQLSEFTLQAPAATDNPARPSPSPHMLSTQPPCTACRPSRALCVPDSTRTGITHIDHDRQNDFVLRLCLSPTPHRLSTGSVALLLINVAAN